MAIIKSQGVTRTERLLADLCDQTFLRFWSYPNPYKDDRKELCDLIVVFGEHVLIFFDRESRRFNDETDEVFVEWNRWKKETVTKQIITAHGAEKYIRSGRPIYLDNKASVPFPIRLPENATIHKFVVAHGAKEACLRFSDENVSGSLGVIYGDHPSQLPVPFVLGLDRSHITHVLDSESVILLFSFLDTMYDFVTYIGEKERAIKLFDFLIYCGEEDLLAYYITNYNEEENRYQIGPHHQDVNGVVVAEGAWKDFTGTNNFSRRLEANKVSILWDDLIQRTMQNALDGTIGGNGNLFGGKSALHEMAREPRFSRRALSANMIRSISMFPESDEPIVRNLSFMPSFFEGVGYVFLQLKYIGHGDYDTQYRPKRKKMLEIACGSARNHFPHLKKVIGIAIDAPKYSRKNSEDFLLMEFDKWTAARAAYYRRHNRGFAFFETKSLTRTEKKNSDFPE